MVEDCPEGVIQRHTPPKQRQVADWVLMECIDKHSGSQFPKGVLLDDKMAAMPVEDVSKKLDDMALGAEQPEVLVGADKSIFT